MARHKTIYISSLIKDFVDAGLSIRQIALMTESPYSSIYNIWQTTTNTVGQELAERIINLHDKHSHVRTTSDMELKLNIGETDCGAPSIERYMRGCRCAECRYIAHEYSTRKKNLTKIS